MQAHASSPKICPCTLLPLYGMSPVEPGWKGILNRLQQPKASPWHVTLFAKYPYVQVCMRVQNTESSSLHDMDVRISNVEVSPQ